MINVESPVYRELNKAWKATCRVLLKDELGELKDYEEWLKEFYPNLLEAKSHVSGENITFRSDLYCDTARFISMNEVKEKDIGLLSINEIKDIDSIVEAVSEKWEYTGNVSLGRSTNVENCDMATDSHYAMFGGIPTRTSYAFATYDAYEAKYIFGSGFHTNGEFLIKFSQGVNIKRCFETNFAFDSSDIYLSHNCRACHDMMFCFHQMNKRNCIGNLELSTDKYQGLKMKLIEEVVDELKSKKRMPSIFESVPDKTFDSSVSIDIPPRESEKEDMPTIEREFSSTFRTLFRKEPGSISGYENWLSKNTVPIGEWKSQFGGDISYPVSKSLKLFSLIPKKRSVTLEEAMQLGKLHATEAEVGDIEKIRRWVSKSGSFTAQQFTGNVKNAIKSVILIESSNAYKCYACVKAEKCGLCSWVLSGTKDAFGSRWVESSQFIMKCYYSTGLNRCFEVDASNNCADSYFCHYCEDLRDAMFCWNAKGKRYAIGNTQLPPEQYRKIKDTLVEQMADEILKKKELKWDIYNIGCRR